MNQNNKQNNISRDDIEKLLYSGMTKTKIAEHYGISRAKIALLIEKYNLTEEYLRYVNICESKAPKFRFRNKELQRKLEIYGPLYNVID